MFRLVTILGAFFLSAQFAYGGDLNATSPSTHTVHGVDVVNVSVRGKQYKDFFAKLRSLESGGNYGAVNTLNFIGAYQFGEAALIDLGYVRRDNNLYDNNFSGGFTGKHGIRSVNDFLKNHQVQDKAAEAWMELMWKYIKADGLERYAWRKVGDVDLTPSGMLAATHLLGSGALKSFVRSKGRNDLRDPYGMPLTQYINALAGYDIPFAPTKPRVVASLGS